MKYGRDRFLQEGVDYSVKYTNNKKAGTATVTVTGKGKFKGSISQDFQILPLDIGGDDFYAPDLLLINNGKAQKKAGALYKDGKVVPKSAYTIEYNDKGDYASDGFYVATIKGKSPNYTGSREYFIRISDTENQYTDVKKAKVTLNSDQIVMTRNGLDWDKFWDRNEDGSLKAFTVTYQGKDVSRAFHEWAPSLDENGGSGYCTIFADPGQEIEGLRFWGTIAVKVKIKTKDINSLVIEGLPAEVEWNTRGFYNGDDLYHDIGMRLKDGEDELYPWEHFETKIKGGNKVGTMTVTITGKRGYSGKMVKKIKIVPVNMEQAVKDGKAFAGCESDWNEDKNWPVVEQPEQIPYAKGGATFGGLCAGLYMENSWEEDGEMRYESWTHWLTEGKDYSVKVTDNTKVGSKAEVTISFKGNYSGSISFTSTVVNRRMVDESWMCGFDIRVTDVVLPKKEAKTMKDYIPKVEVVDWYSGKKLKENVDYTLKYYRYIDDENMPEYKADDPAVEIKPGDYLLVDVIAVEGSGYEGRTGGACHVVEKLMKASDFSIKDQVLPLNMHGDYDEAWYFADPKAGTYDDPYFDIWGASDEDYAAWAAKYFNKIPDGCRIEIGEIKKGDKPGKTATVMLHVNYAGRPGESYVYGGFATVKFKVVAVDLVKN